ncbi:MAG: hypothetical protein EA382_17805 [Spirochaetaceae bacterium]|nr:MAG: hypothetical protein EA382_17805 [Spirochaetaceae bacterium]
MRHRTLLLSALAMCATIAPAVSQPTLAADLTFDTHMYAFRDVVTPYFGAGVSVAARDDAPIGGDSSLFTETGIVTGIAVNAQAAAFRDVLIPLYSSVAIGVDASGRFRGWVALRIGVAGSIVSGWGGDFPWSVGIAGGVATRIAGPLMATIELSTMNAYPGGIASRIVSSRAGIRYAAAGGTQ